MERTLSITIASRFSPVMPRRLQAPMHVLKRCLNRIRADARSVVKDHRLIGMIFYDVTAASLVRRHSDMRKAPNSLPCL